MSCSGVWSQGTGSGQRVEAAGRLRCCGRWLRNATVLPPPMLLPPQLLRCKAAAAQMRMPRAASRRSTLAYGLLPSTVSAPLSRYLRMRDEEEN